MKNALAIVTTDTTDTVQLCDEALAMIRDYEHSVRETSITLGLKLLEVKDTLPHGQFTPWVETVAHWDIRTAQRLMSIARELGDKHDTLTHVPRNMVYQIAKLPANKREDVLTLIIDPAHPPLTEIKTRVKEITEAEILAKRERTEARNQKRAGLPSELALTRRANAKARELAAREDREKQKKKLTVTLTLLFNRLPDSLKNSITQASAAIGPSAAGEALTLALSSMEPPATVEPMPISKQQDDSGDLAVEVTELDVTAA